MCEIYSEKVLNLHCDKCGSNKIKNTADYKLVKTELGLSIPVPIYICEDCKTEFMICPECEGTGFIQNMLSEDYHDCSICYGMGLLKI